MTIWHWTILGVLALQVGLSLWDISRMGFADWFRMSWRKSGFQYLGDRFHGPWRIIVPALELLLIMFCLFQIGVHKK